MSYAPKRNPLISIIGATGTGKSKLAVALAKRFGGEIINGDALQLYEGLPIVTNKISVQEMAGIKHHMLGRLRLDEEPWSVSQFTVEASKVIEEIKSRGKLPILVGGTHYYTQSLLLQDQTLGLEGHEHLPYSAREERWPILKGTDQEILEKLQEVDPVMAGRWHPNDSRKIRRSLEIWLETGQRASELYAEQKGRSPAPMTFEEQDVLPSKGVRESNLRYQNLTFYTFVGKDELDQRIDQRVDAMIEEGLIDEVQHMHAKYTELSASSTSLDMTRGIWVAIGYKEFYDFIAAQDSPLSSQTDIEMLRVTAIEKMKTATRQYSRRQVRWIKQKLLPILLEEGGVDAVVLLTYNDIPEWLEQVEAPAIEAASNFLHGRSLNVAAERKDALLDLIADAQTNSNSVLPQTQVCEICGTIITTKKELEKHSRTKRHRRALGKKNTVVSRLLIKKEDSFQVSEDEDRIVQVTKND